MDNIIFIMLIFGLMVCSILLLRIHKHDKRKWNRGECECGNKWQLVDDSQTMRIYRCNNCYTYISITTDVDGADN